MVILSGLCQDSESFIALFVISVAILMQNHKTKFSCSGFSKNFSAIGFNRRKVNRIIDLIGNILRTNFKPEERIPIENLYDLIAMVMAH
jgi:hypothetical protein